MDSLESVGPVVAASLFMLGCSIYLLPSIIAGYRNHASAWGIFALNVLLGWSLIVWIVALIWALSNKGQAVQQTVIVNNHNNEGHQQAPPPQPIYIPVPQGSSPVQVAVQTPAAVLADMRECPSCAETIKAAAAKCRYCGEQLTPALIVLEGKDNEHGE